jgi:hypothetical protein
MRPMFGCVIFIIYRIDLRFEHETDEILPVSLVLQSKSREASTLITRLYYKGADIKLKEV